MPGADVQASQPQESQAPGDPSSAAREVLWFAPDQSTAYGRWFWGQYQEFGFDVQMRRPPREPTQPVLLALDRSSFQTGSQANRIRLIGEQFPAHIAPGDLSFGAGTTIRRIVSSTPSEIVAEVDVASGALPGKRDVHLSAAALPGDIAVYDRVDYIKLAPESAMAAFGDQSRGLGYEPFEAIAYQRGPDGKLHTADDLELGPVPPSELTWSLDVFYAKPGASTDFVGKIDPSGFFIPAAVNPNTNFDVWVVATAKNLTGPTGRPLVAKAYMVVTVPTYTLNGRRYVRDLDRWVDQGPVQ